MPKVKTAVVLVALVSSSFSSSLVTHAQPSRGKKTVTVKGIIFRGDKQHPVANALILLMNAKEEEQGSSVEAKTDAGGAYRLDGVPEGKYRVSIRTWYDSQEQVPCKLTAAKTKDNNSTVAVLMENGKYVEQVFIGDVSIKAGKEIVRDFDLECKSLFSP
jgi:carboxypeptidase family protein